jgi:uncharacterized membrane protein
MPEDQQGFENLTIPNPLQNPIETNLNTKVEEVIEGLPEKKKTEVKALIRAISIKSEPFKSPIPPPYILKGYNEIIPNGADRILTMAEKQSNHRMSMERAVINREQDQSGKGQNYGFIIALSFLIVSAVLIYTGHEVSGTI